MRRALKKRLFAVRHILCNRRCNDYMEHKLENINDECKKRFAYEGERLSKECERFKENIICDKESYMKRCLGGIEKEDFEKPVCPVYSVVCEPGTTVKYKVNENGCEVPY